MHRARPVAAIAFGVLLLAACSGDPGPSDTTTATATPMSIAEAISADDGTLVRIEGTLFATDDEVRLCSAIGESFPVQCLGDNVAVTGMDPADHDMADGGPGVLISATPVTVEGHIDGGVVTVP